MRMEPQHIRQIVIAGGGTAGWMAAAAFSKVLTGPWKIHLVESDEIGTVGVGEATIPLINIYNEALGIDENEFLRETHGTFKLGIQFVDWKTPGEHYFHGFGPLGPDIGLTRFHQYWLRGQTEGWASGIDDYSINAAAAARNRFMRARKDLGMKSPLAEISHAFHFDAGLYARFLRRFAEARGVQRTEGKIVGATMRESDGHIDAIVLEGGQRIEGDLFIDCTGFRGLLIEQMLHTGFDDWSDWLPSNRAWAVPCESVSPLTPYTRSTARQAGWQWRIPLQHRIGNGHVFCNDFISEDEAASILLANLDGPKLADPRLLKFTTGKRRQHWNRNVVAVGLASGFMEPLESTSIHLIQASISRLVQFFPDQSFEQADIDEFNRQTDFEWERCRDFLILHYILNERSEPFWQRCREIALPDSLQRKLALFRSSGRIVREDRELFSEISWLEVMWGQGLRPQRYDPVVDALPAEKIRHFLDNVRGTILKCAELMPSHKDYVDDECPMAR